MCSSDLKSGTWFSFKGQRIGQGRENAKTFLKEHPEVEADLERAIRENAGILSDALMTAGGDNAAADEE